MTVRLALAALALAAALPSGARAGGLLRVLAPGPGPGLPAIAPAAGLAPAPALIAPSLTPALAASVLAAPAAPAPLPAAVRGMEAMMLRDLARERALRSEEPATSALEEAKALAEAAGADSAAAGRAPWVREALLLRDLRRDEPRRRAIAEDQAVYRRSMARAAREPRR